jgi:RNA polymerase sigma-70 factor, ECF subfamily
MSGWSRSRYLSASDDVARTLLSAKCVVAAKHLCKRHDCPRQTWDMLCTFARTRVSEPHKSEKYLNKSGKMAVFMFEGRRALTGHVIVSDAMAPARADDDQLEAVIREHARLVYRVAYSVLRNHHDAEDATQETFIRVLRYRKKLPGVRNPRTWLARIAWRVAIERRKKAPDSALENTEVETAELRSQRAGADEILLGSEMRQLLAQLIAALPEKLRDPLTLATVEEMSPADIATVLGIREAAVRSRVFRARQILQEKLKGLMKGRYGI